MLILLFFVVFHVVVESEKCYTICVCGFLTILDKLFCLFYLSLSLRTQRMTANDSTNNHKQHGGNIASKNYWNALVKNA